MGQIILIKKYSRLWKGYECCRVIYFDNRDRIIYWHKYLWEKENGQTPIGYELHHKDHNKLNNDLSNLECLTKRDHALKHVEEFKLRSIKSFDQKYIKKICTWCKKEYYQNINNSNKALKRNPNKKDFCSKGCTSRYYKAQPIVHGTYRGYCWYKCKCNLCYRAYRDKTDEIF